MSEYFDFDGLLESDLSEGNSYFGDNVMLVINVDDSLVGFFFGCCQKNIKSTTFVTNIDEAR